MRGFKAARARWIAVSLAVVSVSVARSTPPGGQQLLAQSEAGVSRPWACWASSIADQSIFRPETPPSVCAEATPRAPILLGPRIRARAAAPIVAPGAPTSLVAAISNRNVALTWTAPSGGDPPSSYVLEAGSASGLSDLANSDTGSSTPSLTATNVAPGTYFVRVRARNASGTSAPSNEIIVIVTGGCAIAPDAPGSLGAIVSGSTVTLTWSGPSGGCAPSSYLIEAGSAPGLTNLASISTGNPATLYSAAGVGAGTYYVRIRSVKPAGTSGPSNEIQLTVGGCSSAPSAPLAFSAQVSGTTVVLAWAAATGSPASYVLEAGSSPGASDVLVLDTGGTATTLTAIANAGTYYVRVRAKNACGQSAVSNEVIVVVNPGGNICASISPTSQTFGNAAALGSVTVTAPNACSWVAFSNASFITITSGSSGSGSGTVNYTVAANDTGSTRTGTLTIANQTFTVTQQTCTYTLSPLAMLVADGGGAFSVGLTTGSACTWTAASNAPFVILTSPTISSGSGMITINVQPDSGTGRGGTLTIAGQTVTVVQTGPAGFPNCSASILRCQLLTGCDAVTFTGAGGTGEVLLGAPSDCAWMASATVPWASVYSTSPVNQPYGVGNGHFGYSVQPNSTGAQRTGTIVAGGGTFTITQTACAYTVSPTSATVGAGGATGGITVSTTCDAPWTATSNASFITVVGGSSGTGNGTVTVTIAANSGPTRSGTLTIAGQTVTITQLAP
jgi:hypothetical protein